MATKVPMPKEEFLDKMSVLLRDLLKATHDGKITWHETADEHSFRTRLVNGLVRIGQRPLSPSPHEDLSKWFYDVDLMDQRGQIVDNVMICESGVNYKLAKELFETIRRSSVDVSQFLDKLILEVESK